MKRRYFLIILGNTTTVAISGCSLSANDSQNTGNNSEDTTDVGDSGPSSHNTHPTEQGDAEPVTLTVDGGGGQNDIGESECRNLARETMSSILTDEHDFDNLLITAKNEIVLVTIHSTVYDRTGEKIQEIEYEFDGVKNVTPSNMFIESEDGTVACEYPVYVAAKEIQYD